MWKKTFGRKKAASSMLSGYTLSTYVVRDNELLKEKHATKIGYAFQSHPTARRRVYFPKYFSFLSLPQKQRYIGWKITCWPYVHTFGRSIAILRREFQVSYVRFVQSYVIETSISTHVQSFLLNIESWPKERLERFVLVNRLNRYI
jgi:hypothetical protein